MGENNTFCIHYRSYDFISDTYAWHTDTYINESCADTALHTHHCQDTDCWCIDIQGKKNYFADVMTGI